MHAARGNCPNKLPRNDDYEGRSFPDVFGGLPSFPQTAVIDACIDKKPRDVDADWADKTRPPSININKQINKKIKKIVTARGEAHTSSSLSAGNGKKLPWDLSIYGKPRTVTRSIMS